MAETNVNLVLKVKVLTKGTAECPHCIKYPVENKEAAIKIAQDIQSEINLWSPGSKRFLNLQRPDGVKALMVEFASIAGVYFAVQEDDSFDDEEDDEDT